MSHRSHLRVIAGGLVAALQLVVLLMLEVVVTMLVYTYLNLFHLTTFGALVRVARSVLDFMAGQLDYWLQGSANAAYATLIGELGPKSILLLLIGLVVAAIVRGSARVASRVAAGMRRAPAAPAR